MGMSDDELVSDYLRHLEAAASELPADRRRELLEEITTHIAEARSASPVQPGGVRAILDQLGAPEEIVRADGIGGAASPRSRMPEQLGTLEIVAIVLLLIGGVVLPVIGWAAGVVLLWLSPRWGLRDKLLGTLVWPGGLLAPIVVFVALAGAALFTTQACYLSSSGQVCTGQSLPSWLAITLSVIAIIASVAGPIWMTARLVRQARKPLVAAEEPGQGMLISSMPA
ncbi:MAG TPA: hypothetical protein VFI65_02265 [Streptosporangiaceae bacterium]|nr:hypothetical protein [Streptosporangiaceae bacterium]